MSQDREKQERLLRLAGWLHHKHQFQTKVAGSEFTEVRFTREDLADVPAFGAYAPARGDAGEQAFHRDVQALADFGVGIRWDPVRSCWTSRITPLTDAECRALATAALAVIVEDGSTEEQGFHIPGAGLSVEGAEVIVGYASEIDVLIDAIRKRHSVEILHRNEPRIVDPWEVRLEDGRWYLVCWDHSKEDLRTFSLAVIESVAAKPRDADFHLPDRGREPSQVRTSDPDSWVDTEPIEIELDVDARLVSRAESILGAVGTGPGDRPQTVRMTCSVRSVDAFIHHLWALGARAVVVGPQEIRDQIVSALEVMV